MLMKGYNMSKLLTIVVSGNTLETSADERIILTPVINDVSNLLYGSNQTVSNSRVIIPNNS